MAHPYRDLVTAALNRGDQLDQRRELLEDWAEFVAQSESAARGR